MRQSSCRLLHINLVLPAAKTKRTARNQPVVRQGLLLSAAHKASSARCKTEADCTKHNILHGKPSRWPMLSSAFRPTHNQSVLHEAQPLVRQSYRHPQHIQLVPPAAKLKRTARNSIACTARLSLSAAHSARSALLRNRSRLHEAQSVVQQSSLHLLHIQLVPPTAQPKRSARTPTACTARLSPSAAYPARSARCKTEAVSQTSTACTARLLPSAAYPASAARCKTEADCTNTTACTARLLLSAAHQARSARRKTEADCTKSNRLYGKAIAVRYISG